MASPDPRKDLKSRSPEKRDPHYYKGYFIRAPLRNLFFLRACRWFGVSVLLGVSDSVRRLIEAFGFKAEGTLNP